MPDSQFVRSSQLKPLLVYLTSMVVGLLVADVVVLRVADTPGARLPMVLGWLCVLPIGGWRIWRRSG